MKMYYLLALVVVAYCIDQDPCDEFYCANGGVCILKARKCTDRHVYLGKYRHYEPTCQCTGAWKGERCDDDPCGNVDCNNGTCTPDENGQANCSCPDMTSGEFCEIIDDPCVNVDCNNGTCTPDEHGQANCSCPESRSGEFCEIVVCPQLEHPKYGKVTIEGITVGSNARYECYFSNMALCNNEKLTCGDDGKWDKEPPVCVEKVDTVNNLTVSYGDSTYYLSNEQLTFADSQAYCENLGGNLVSINSDDEWEFIKCLYGQKYFGATNIFIGLLNIDGEWTWSSGEPVTVTYWDPWSGDQDLPGTMCATYNNEDWTALSDFYCITGNNEFLCETKQRLDIDNKIELL